MINDFDTLDEAVKSWWTDKAWDFSRRYFNGIGEACVCLKNDRHFIITHPDCVAYRKRLGTMVLDLAATNKHYI